MSVLLRMMGVDWFWIGAVLVLTVGGSAGWNARCAQPLTNSRPPTRTHTAPSDPFLPNLEPPPTEEEVDEEECRENPGACSLATAAAELLGRLFETVFTDLRGRDQSPLLLLPSASSVGSAGSTV